MSHSDKYVCIVFICPFLCQLSTDLLLTQSHHDTWYIPYCNAFIPLILVFNFMFFVVIFPICFITCWWLHFSPHLLWFANIFIKCCVKSGQWLRINIHFFLMTKPVHRNIKIGNAATDNKSSLSLSLFLLFFGVFPV